MTSDKEMFEDMCEIYHNLQDDLEMDPKGEEGYATYKEVVDAVNKYTYRLVKKKVRKYTNRLQKQ